MTSVHDNQGISIPPLDMLSIEVFLKGDLTTI